MTTGASKPARRSRRPRTKSPGAAIHRFGAARAGLLRIQQRPLQRLERRRASVLADKDLKFRSAPLRSDRFQTSNDILRVSEPHDDNRNLDIGQHSAPGARWISELTRPRAQVRRRRQRTNQQGPLTLPPTRLAKKLHNRGRGAEQSPNTTCASIMDDGAKCRFRALREQAALGARRLARPRDLCELRRSRQGRTDRQTGPREFLVPARSFAPR